MDFNRLVVWGHGMGRRGGVDASKSNGGAIGATAVGRA